MGGGSGRLRNVTDYLWKQERRTTMRYGIDTLEKLKTRIGDLEDVGERVINHLNMVTRDILVQEAAIRSAITSTCTNGFIRWDRLMDGPWRKPKWNTTLRNGPSEGLLPLHVSFAFVNFIAIFVTLKSPLGGLYS
eukprot:scaffold174018_cov24-Attheya_sp.AAC.1